MKILLCGKRIIEQMKNDDDYAGSLYLELPSEGITLDLDAITPDIDTLYVSYNSRYMFFLWQHFDALSHLKIYLVDTIDEAVVTYPYRAPKEALTLEMFETVAPKALQTIYVLGTSEQIRPVEIYLNAYDYTVRRIEANDLGTLPKDAVVMNCSQVSQAPCHGVLCEGYILNVEIRQMIDRLSQQKGMAPARTWIDFLLSGYEKTQHNPFAALAYLYQTMLPKPKQKSIAFYAPSCAYRNNLLTQKIYDRVSQTYNTYFLYATQCNDRFETLENSYYVGNCLIGYFEFLDVLIYPALTLVLPQKPKKLYLLHDIYDSPLGTAEEPIRASSNAAWHASQFLEAVDYIFLPGPSVLEAFSKKLMRNVCYIQGGYFKLDGNIERFQTYSNEQKADSIIYAPTVINDVLRKHHSQIDYGIKIVQALLEHFQDDSIIFRPHPHSVNDTCTSAIVDTFKNERRFVFDDNPSDYMRNYARSKLMVTDISGTAYTYAFTTQRPVIFFSVDEEHVESDLGGVAYFKDREKIGSVVESIDAMVAQVQTCLAHYEEVTTSVEAFRREAVYHVGASEAYFIASLPYIVDDVKHPDWIYVREGQVYA